MINNKETKKVVYTCVVGDLFHHGHLKALKFAKSLGDYLIVGVLTDETVQNYRKKPIIDFENRKFIIESLNFIDEVIVENNIDATNTLKNIYNRFKNSKIILVRGERWKFFPEKDYLNTINGEIVKYSHSNDLSEFKILKYLLESYKGKFKTFDEFINYFKVRDFVDYDTKKIKTAIISTKANTLKNLNPLLKHSNVEKTFVFSLKEWKENKNNILENIKKEFSSDLVVIRSSTLNEDSYESSMAGYYDTKLNIPSNDMEKIEDAIIHVINSYKDKSSLNEFNQILIQKQTTEIVISGVVLTRKLENGSPYYTINYDDITGYSNTVTQGMENKTLYISRFLNPKKYPNKFYKLLMAVKEVEQLVEEIPLDIEFAVNKNEEVIIFQVRPLIIRSKLEDFDEEDIEESIKQMKENFNELSKRKDHLASDYTCFADMPDWNPAEIIGDRPNYLDYSLYDYLITNSIWHEARTSQNYYNVNPAKLIVLFGDKPYVDVRSTFNSFTPMSISMELRKKLINFYINKLKKNPELQDKVEFEILHTCYDLTLDEKLNELLNSGFTQNEINELKIALLNITNNLILNSEISIEEDLNSNNKMDFLRKKIQNFLNNNEKNPKILIGFAFDLLDDCKKNGTLQFSRLARLAFIGKIILKSLVKKGVIDKNNYESFLNSINTIAKSLNLDFVLFLKGKLSKNDFLNKYGHLRPGTYDITSKIYYDNQNLLESKSELVAETYNNNFIFDNKTLEYINKELNINNLKFNALYLLNFIKKSIEARELSKFEFTKSLSYAIELIAEAGNQLGFLREEMAQLDIEFLSKINEYSLIEIRNIWKKLIKSRSKRKSLYKNLILPSLIFSENDFEIIQPYYPKPNFITRKKINSKIINITSLNKESLPDLKEKIVLLENGDPGYDWIFTKEISGLITKYGGVASHMAIRCAEFGLPAAIGCGELFDKIKNESNLFLDCESEKISSIKNGLIF